IEKLGYFIESIEDRIRTELRERCEALKPDFLNPEIFTVLLALLARQATLAIQLASAPQLWNSHSAPLFLRAMADLHITFSWIVGDPPARAKQYIEHGLGQAVLLLEHRKSIAAGSKNKDAIQASIDAVEAWI